MAKKATKRRSRPSNNPAEQDGPKGKEVPIIRIRMGENDGIAFNKVIRYPNGCPKWFVKVNRGTDKEPDWKIEEDPTLTHPRGFTQVLSRSHNIGATKEGMLHADDAMGFIVMGKAEYIRRDGDPLLSDLIRKFTPKAHKLLGEQMLEEVLYDEAVQAEEEANRLAEEERQREQANEALKKTVSEAVGAGSDS